ncbi:Enterobactin synthase component F [Dissostichus eleginoides]|uniref:Enterobactin synthase component F n=1 Tax=Dissostichus eleginoides TaxID=100907 RepID=A0AAD9B8R7_DISEL|nr:Enterobactin synthase component F [Dissostichus eleginoides]
MMKTMDAGEEKHTSWDSLCTGRLCVGAGRFIFFIITAEIDGGEDAMTRSKTEALPPLQEIGCFRNRSGISSLSRPLPPQSRKRR